MIDDPIHLLSGQNSFPSQDSIDLEPYYGRLKMKFFYLYLLSNSLRLLFVAVVPIPRQVHALRFAVYDDLHHARSISSILNDRRR